MRMVTRLINRQEALHARICAPPAAKPTKREMENPDMKKKKRPRAAMQNIAAMVVRAITAVLNCWYE